MDISQTFSDKRSGDPTVATETFAHGGELVGHLLATRYATEFPDSRAFADPALFTVSGSNPNSGLFAVVVYAKRPFGLEIVDVFVGDGHFPEGVYDHQMLVFKHKLGPHPKQQSANRNRSDYSDLNPVHGVVNRVEHHLSQEQTIEDDCHNGPGEVAFRPEDVFVTHASIIAGITAVQEGK